MAIQRRLFRFLFLPLLAAALFSPGPVSAQTNIFTDFASFKAATGPLTEIDFENLPHDATISNPLTLNGVTFTDPHNLSTGFCTSPTCQPDPDNQLGGNIALFLNPDGTIDFPAGTGGVMLVVEGIGDTPYAVQVTDFAGNTITANGKGILYGVEYLGFTSTSGIQRLKVVSTGPTADCPYSNCGPIPLSAIFTAFDDPDVTQSVWSDPVNDVSISNTDIIYGSANVFGEVVDLRVQFLAPPFTTDEPQTITWCFDTDQNASTGSICSFGSPTEADQILSLHGSPEALLLGGGFSISGSLGILDPCAIGSFNWESNVLRLVVPSTFLMDDGIFNYAVKSTLGGGYDKAPNSVNFGSPGKFFTSQTDALLFSGSPLCSSQLETSLTIIPDQAGHIKFFPELDIMYVNPSSGIQSNYFKTTDSNREFRRGIFEFIIPKILDKIANATLIYNDLRSPLSYPRPTVIHEMSYYQPADLAIDESDYDRPTTFLASLETDVNSSQNSFSIDITNLIEQFDDSTLGFRIKLAVDPTYNEFDGFGWGFGELSTNSTPSILVNFTDAKTTVHPTIDSTLAYTDTQGNSTHVLVPANTVTETTDLLYDAQAMAAKTSSKAAFITTATVPFGLRLVSHEFILDGYRNGEYTTSSILQGPMVLTVSYTENEVVGVDEDTLVLYYWDGSDWQAAACGPYERHPDENRLTVPVCQFDEFALFGQAVPLDPQAYLPILLKKK